MNQVPNYGSKLKNDLLRGIPRVWTNYFMLDKDKDVAFEVGRFYYITREYAKALEFYRISSETIGEHHATAHNMGLCYYSMSKFPEAMECFSKSLELNKDFEKVRFFSIRFPYCCFYPLTSPSFFLSFFLSFFQGSELAVEGRGGIDGKGKGKGDSRGST